MPDGEKQSMFKVSETGSKNADKLKQFLSSDDNKLSLTQYNIVLIIMLMILVVTATIVHFKQKTISSKIPSKLKNNKFSKIIIFGFIGITLLPLLAVLQSCPQKIIKKNVAPVTAPNTTEQKDPALENVVSEEITPKKQKVLLHYQKTLFCDIVNPCEKAMTANLALNDKAQNAVFTCACSYEKIVGFEETRLNNTDILAPENREILESLRNIYEKIINAKLIDANRILDSNEITSYTQNSSKQNMSFPMEKLREMNEKFGIADIVYQTPYNNELNNIDCDSLKAPYYSAHHIK